MLYEVCNKVGLEEQMLGRKGELMVLFHMYVRQQITAAVAVAGAHAVADRSAAAASSLLVGFVPWNRNALSHPLFLYSCCPTISVYPPTLLANFLTNTF